MVLDEYNVFGYLDLWGIVVGITAGHVAHLGLRRSHLNPNAEDSWIALKQHAATSLGSEWGCEPWCTGTYPRITPPGRHNYTSQTLIRTWLGLSDDKILNSGCAG